MILDVLSYGPLWTAAYAAIVVALLVRCARDET